MGAEQTLGNSFQIVGASKTKLLTKMLPKFMHRRTKLRNPSRSFYQDYHVSRYI